MKSRVHAGAADRWAGKSLGATSTNKIVRDSVHERLLFRVTIFLGCGFAAKYRDGGGVFSVPLQWMLGLRRLNLDAIWLEVFPSSGNETADAGAIRSFQAQVRSYGLSQNYCLLYQSPAADAHELGDIRCF